MTGINVWVMRLIVLASFLLPVLGIGAYPSRGSSPVAGQFDPVSKEGFGRSVNSVTRLS